MHRDSTTLDGMWSPLTAGIASTAGRQSRTIRTAVELRVAGVIRGDTLPPLEMSERLGWTRELVRKRHAAGRLFGLHLEGPNVVAYPVWQVKMVRERPSRLIFAKILAALKGCGDVSVYRFFTETNPDLGGKTPVDAWRRSSEQVLVQAAQKWAVTSESAVHEVEAHEPAARTPPNRPISL